MLGYVLSGTPSHRGEVGLCWTCFAVIGSIFALTCMTIYVVDHQQIEERDRVTKEKAKHPWMA